MGTRAYKRDSHGRFAGGGGGTVVTYGKAGGFANAGHQSKAQAARANRRNSKRSSAFSKSLRRTLKSRTMKKVYVAGGSYAVGLGLAGVAGPAAKALTNRKFRQQGFSIPPPAPVRIAGDIGAGSRMLKFTKTPKFGKNKGVYRLTSMR